MPKLTKQDIQDIANGYTIKYVSNSFTKDELIIELAQLCLQAIDEKEDILSQPVELDEEEQTMADKIEQNIREIASRYKWAINEKNLPKIANAKRRFFGEEDWSRCPCYPPEDNTHSCGSAACCQEITKNGICHCNLFMKDGEK